MNSRAHEWLTAHDLTTELLEGAFYKDCVRVESTSPLFYIVLLVHVSYTVLIPDDCYVCKGLEGKSNIH